MLYVEGEGTPSSIRADEFPIPNSQLRTDPRPRRKPYYHVDISGFQNAVAVAWPEGNHPLRPRGRKAGNILA
jgi:hypothetical protein|uniref:Uncharacterized protein n=1 Tax=Picea glauca TaxID=3330 RepID=A0A101LVU9_PICGL|nr:hypothetical protein ABT39_MTgene1783 [Picea glauca]QHR90729.1 hypothetical protein Q903MT_gene4755 [Picea sitchensis]